MSTPPKKQAKPSTNIRHRRACLNGIRKQLTIQYHILSAQWCEDQITDRPLPAKSAIQTGADVLEELAQGELAKAVDILSDAINCLNRELGRKENSRADGDGTA